MTLTAKTVYLQAKQLDDLKELFDIIIKDDYVPSDQIIALTALRNQLNMES